MFPLSEERKRFLGKSVDLPIAMGMSYTVSVFKNRSHRSNLGVYRFWQSACDIAVVFRDLDLLFQGRNISNVNISKTVRASVKLQETTFVDFNICYVMASL